MVSFNSSCCLMGFTEDNKECKGELHFMVSFNSSCCLMGFTEDNKESKEELHFMVSFNSRCCLMGFTEDYNSLIGYHYLIISFMYFAHFKVNKHLDQSFIYFFRKNLKILHTDF